MEKKVIYWIAYLIATVLLFLAVIYKANIAASGLEYDQKYLSVQLAGVEDALLSSPGNINLNFDLKEDSNLFDINFENCGVFIGLTSKRFGNSFDCSDDLNLNKHLSKITNAEVISFEKEENKITIS